MCLRYRETYITFLFDVCFNVYACLNSASEKPQKTCVENPGNRAEILKRKNGPLDIIDFIDTKLRIYHFCSL